MPFFLPNIKFSKNSMHPFLSEETITFHYEKHHKAYIDNLNKLIEGTPFSEMTLENIVQVSDGIVFNNAAQAWNHEFYWESLSPSQMYLAENSKLFQLITKEFVTLEKLKEKFISSAGTLFGSGWTWLVLDQENKLQVINSQNADVPIKQGLKPLLVCDVWEHAYYIDYRNSRSNYLEAFWKHIDWKKVEERFLNCF